MTRNRRALPSLLLCALMFFLSVGCSSTPPESGHNDRGGNTALNSGAPPTDKGTAASAASSASGAPQADNSNTIKIGFITSLSGAGAEAGKQMLNGLQLYLDQVHNQMAGKKIQLIVENDESSPVTAMARVRKLVENDKVSLLSGIFFAHIMYAIAPLIEKYKIPFVDVVSGADDLTQRKRSPWLVRTSWSSSQPAHPFGEYAYKNLGYKKIVTIASDYPYGYEVVGGFQQSFEQVGGQIVQKLWPPLGGLSDYSELIGKIDKNADAVFMCLVGPSAETLPKQYKDKGPKLPIIGATTGFDESIYPRMGDELIGAISTNPYSTALDTPANKRFVSAYQAKYGSDPGWFSECGYTAGMWIHKALELVHGNTANREKLLTALKTTELSEAPRGPLKLDEYGNPIDNIYVRKVERVNGKLQNTVIHTFPAVSQFWTFKPSEYLQQPPYTKDYPPCTHCENP